MTGETWGDEVDSVRTYLLDESERSLTDLMPVVWAERQQLLDALLDSSEAQIEFVPATGEGEDGWGLAEVLRHVASIEVIFAGRIRQLGLGEAVNVTKTYPGYMEDISTRNRSELIEAFEASGRAMLDAIAAIDGHEVLEPTDPHRLFGELNCRGWFRLHGLHLLDHAHQVGKIKLMDGYPAA